MSSHDLILGKYFSFALRKTEQILFLNISLQRRTVGGMFLKMWSFLVVQMLQLIMIIVMIIKNRFCMLWTTISLSFVCFKCLKLYQHIHISEWVYTIIVLQLTIDLLEKLSIKMKCSSKHFSCYRNCFRKINGERNIHYWINQIKTLTPVAASQQPCSPR